MKILIVEDDPDIAAAVSRGLTQQGYAVDIAGDGEEGLAAIEIAPEEIDLVLLDSMLPGKTGIEICKTVREQGITLPIIMLTARDSSADTVEGLDAGADDYLTKPFEFTVLLARIRSLLRRPVHSFEKQLTAGGIVLDVSAHTVSGNGKDIRLTNREFAILEYLMRNRGKTVSREQILSHVWDQSFNSFSNVVDVHIASLKRKLYEHTKTNPVETVRGIGFRIGADPV